MSKMLLLAPSAYLWGGVQTWLDQTAAGLRTKGWGVGVALVQGSVHHDPVKYAAQHPGHRVVPVKCLTATPEGRARAIVRALEGERPDVLVLVNIADGLEAARRWKETRGTDEFRVAYTIHAFLPGQIADVASYASTVDRVVGTNRLLEKALRSCLGDQVQIGYAPYGTEAPRVHVRRDGGSEDRLRLAWVGRMEEAQKRASDVVPLLRRCRALGLDFTCDVVGDGPSSGRVRRELADLEVAGHVRFRGYLQREVLYEDVYPGLDALLLTSSWETGPIVAWEAMRHGACVVSTRYVGLAEEGALVDGENCLLAENGDVEGLSDAVVRLARDRGLRDRLGRRAKEVADRRYSLEASLDAWHGQLLETARSPRKAPGRSRAVTPAAGRLDKWLGPSLGESVRALAGMESLATRNAGGEWPHELHRKAVPLGPIAERLALLLTSRGSAPLPSSLPEGEER